METKTKNSPTTSNSKPARKKRTPSPQHSAQEKVQAVLAVWTDRCKAVEACRQLNITAMTFQQWQRRAMEGMLQALESRVNLSQGQVLSPRLQHLLRNHQRPLNHLRLAQRFEQVNKLASKEPSAAQPQ